MSGGRSDKVIHSRTLTITFLPSPLEVGIPSRFKRIGFTLHLYVSSDRDVRQLHQCKDSFLSVIFVLITENPTPFPVLDEIFVPNPLS